MKPSLVKQWQRLKDWTQELSGQTQVEYVLILVLASVIIFTLLIVMGDPLREFFQRVTQTMSRASG